MYQNSRSTKLNILRPFTPRLTDLSLEEKNNALNSWEQDARQQLTASNEGMAGSKEGIDPSDHSRLGEIERAKDKIGEKPEHKPSH